MPLRRIHTVKVTSCRLVLGVSDEAADGESTSDQEDSADSDTGDNQNRVSGAALFPGATQEAEQSSHTFHCSR